MFLNSQKSCRKVSTCQILPCIDMLASVRSRSRSPSQRSIFTSIVWIEDLENSASISTFNRDRQDHDLDLRSFPPRSNNAVVACCVCKFRCYITEYRCIVCIVAAMCSIQCRAMCCVIAGTTALLSVLLFTSSC